MNRIILFAALLFIVVIVSVGCDSDGNGPTGASSDSRWEQIHLDTIIVSSDSSVTPWDTVTLPLENFYSVSFLDENTGWIVGDAGDIFKTSDGGKTWNLVYRDENIWLFDVYPIDTNLIWAVGMHGSYPYQAAIVNSVDGGLNWITTYTGNNAQFRSVKFIDALNGFIVGGSWPNGGIDSAMMRTIDGGVTWDSTYILKDRIIASVDSSVTPWDTVYKNLRVELNDLDFGGNLSGCIVGTNTTIHVTSDGGFSWTRTDSIADSSVSYTVTFDGDLRFINLYGVDMVDDSHGWAVGSFSTILKTTDGGITWQRQYVDSTVFSSFRSVSFLDRNNGIAVGDGGKAVITADGGSNWEDISFQSKDANVALEDVCYLAAGKYLAVGEDMLIIISK